MQKVTEIKSISYYKEKPDYSKFLAATLICLLVLCLGNFIAAALASTNISPNFDISSYEAPRNPHFRRNFESWTAAPDPLPEGRRVIIISNSQGFLREKADGQLTYAAILEEKLNQGEGPPWHVLNWSVDGGQGPEMVVLAARTAIHKPDLVLLVSHASSFTGPATQKPLSFGISDVPSLAHLSLVNKYLSKQFKEIYEVDTWLNWLYHHTGYGTLRRRLRVADYAAEQETWTWAPEKPQVELDDIDETDELWTPRSIWLLQEFASTLHRASPDSPLMIVSMPLPESAWSEPAWSQQKFFFQRVEAALKPLPYVTVMDAISQVSDQEFFTHTHLRPSGHQIFADWLYDQIIKSKEVNLNG